MKSNNVIYHEKLINTKLINELYFAKKYNLKVKVFAYSEEYIKKHGERSGVVKWSAKNKTILMDNYMMNEYMSLSNDMKKNHKQMINYYYKFMFWHEMAHIIENKSNGLNEINDFNKAFTSTEKLSDQSILNEIEVFKIQFQLMRHFGYNPKNRNYMPQAIIKHFVEILVSRIIKKYTNEEYTSVVYWIKDRIPHDALIQIKELEDNKNMVYDPILAELYMKELDEALNEIK